MWIDKYAMAKHVGAIPVMLEATTGERINFYSNEQSNTLKSCKY